MGSRDVERARFLGGAPVLVAADLRWPDRFAAAASALLGAAGTSGLAAVEHIGSTAVPGLAAKPVLDLMPGYVREEDVPGIVTAITGLGYTYRGALGIPDRHYFNRVIEDDDAVWKHNVHMYRVGHPEWIRHLAFRDALRRSATTRDAYAELKHRLAEEFPTDIEAYADGKTDFVDAVIRAAGGPARSF